MQGKGPILYVLLAMKFCLSFWCLVIGVWLSLAMPRVSLQFVIVAFPDHTQLLFIPIGQFRQLYLGLLKEKQSIIIHNNTQEAYHELPDTKIL